MDWSSCPQAPLPGPDPESPPPRLAKFLCSFGGSVLPRPVDGRLRYVGGETRIIAVPLSIPFPDLLQKLRDTFPDSDVNFIKYQQPDEDLDALVSVVNDDDVLNMMDEYHKLVSNGEPFTRLRLFLFSSLMQGSEADSPPVFEEVMSERGGGGGGGGGGGERRYVDALNNLVALNSPDTEFAVPGLRHLNVPTGISVYGQRFSDVDSPWSAGYLSPSPFRDHSVPVSPSAVKFEDLVDQGGASCLPAGGPAVQDNSGFPCNLGRGESFADGNGNFCEHCHVACRQCVAPPDARYVDPPHRYYAGQAGHFHGGINNGHNNPCTDCYHLHNNNGHGDSYHYYYNDPHGHDNRMWGPHPHHNQINFWYDDPRAHRAPVPVPVPVHDPYIPDGNRTNYPYLHGNCNSNNHLFGTEAHNNEMFHNITQQQRVEMSNLESLSQVPQNLPPIPSLRTKMQLQQLHVAGLNGMNGVNVINPQFIGTTPDTPNGGMINPQFIRNTPDGTPNGGMINPQFIRNTPDGAPNGGLINPQFIRNTDGTPNGAMINPQFIRNTPDGTPNGGIINPLFPPNGHAGIKAGFMIGTPDGSPRPSNVSPYDRIQTQIQIQIPPCTGFSDKFPGLDSPAVLTPTTEYGGSRLNPNAVPTLQCQPVMETPVVQNQGTSQPVMDTPVVGNQGTSQPVMETPIMQNRGTIQPVMEAPVVKDQGTSQPVMETPVMENQGTTALPIGARLTGKAVDEAECKEKEQDKETVVVRTKDETVQQNGEVCKEGNGGLVETVKKVSLREEKEKKEGAQNEERTEVDQADKETNVVDQSGLREAEHENGNADLEAETEGHDEQEEQNTKIEPSSAVQEALDKGLQTIKNEDLEEIKELGSGTFGSVFHGKWRGTDVAIKRIKASCFKGRPSEREKLIADFWKEATILGSLHHPNVVSFYGVVSDGPDGSLATVTEFMVNGSLKQFLHKKDRTIDRRKRLIIAMDAAFGMEYLHGKNIVHFDLKCENLLVNMRDPHRPICKIGDLGLSKVKQHTLVSGGIRGTLPWMAPELLSGKDKKVSEKIDVYSFGVCMWELLTGEEPYAEMRAASIIGGLVNNSLRPEIPAWCDPEWKGLMESCWDADPKQRPSFSEISQKLRKMAAAINVK